MRLPALPFAAAAMLFLSACTSNTSQAAQVVDEPTTQASNGAAGTPAPSAKFIRIGETDIGETTLIVLRDQVTGCDWIWAEGYKAGEIQARTRPSGQICGSSAKASGFQIVSSDDIGGSTDIIVARDIDTGCDWLWVEGYKAGSLKPRMKGEHQVCTQHS